MAHTYGPGAGYVVAKGDYLIFLPDDAKPDTLRELWLAQSQVKTKGFLGALSAVAKSLDPTLERLPRFAVVELGDQTQVSQAARIAVCGELNVVVEHASGVPASVFRGNGAAMWLEEQVADAVSFRISSGSPETTRDIDPVPFAPLRGLHENLPEGLDPENVSSHKVLLPLAEGIVRADMVAWSFEPVAARGTPTRAVSVQSARSLDDLGQTLAELPEEWFGQGEDDVYEDSEVDPTPIGPVPVHEAATQVFGTPPPDVMPTEVIATAAEIAAAHVAAAQTTAFETANAAAYAVHQGYVRFSHGEVIELGVPLVIGRKPTHEGSGAQPFARMVSVPSPSKDISRNHLLIRVEQGHVLAQDLGSVNGTLLRRSGQPDRQLQSQQATLILSDDVLDLGDGVTLTFEQLR
jgi:hypothetical protein